MKSINKIFGFLVLIMLFAGGLSLCGYMIAFLIGGSKAESLCKLIQIDIYPYMIQITSIGVAFGLISMYLSGSKALSIKKQKEEKHK